MLKCAIDKNCDDFFCRCKMVLCGWHYIYVVGPSAYDNIRTVAKNLQTWRERCTIIREGYRQFRMSSSPCSPSHWIVVVVCCCWALCHWSCTWCRLGCCWASWSVGSDCSTRGWRWCSYHCSPGRTASTDDLMIARRDCSLASGLYRDYPTKINC